MSVRAIQYLIAAVFFILCGWSLVAPASVLTLGLRPEFQDFDKIHLIMTGCFGAQACLAGAFVAFSTFTKRTFIAFGVAVLPFFGFDYYFYAVEPIFNELILIDALGNVIFIALCAYGYRRAPAP